MIEMNTDLQNRPVSHCVWKCMVSGLSLSLVLELQKSTLGTFKLTIWAAHEL